jgi:hypothetical protein
VMFRLGEGIGHKGREGTASQRDQKRSGES